MKIKSFFCMVIILSIIVNPITIIKAETNNKDSKANDNDKYEVYYSEPVELEYCLDFAADTIPDYVTGVYNIGDDSITFGIKNISGDNLLEFSNTMAELLYDTILEDYELKLTRSNINNQSIKIKKIEYTHFDVQNKNIDSNFVNDNNCKSGFYNLEMQKQISMINNNEAGLNDEWNDFLSTMPLNTSKGGPIYSDIVGTINPFGEPTLNPYKGDRQDRARLKARFDSTFDTNTYFWWPNFTSAQTHGAQTLSSSSYIDSNAITIHFKWDQERLNNLVIDGNEAIEIEALFYNYGSDSSIPGDGSAWMIDEPDYWVTNLPNAYLDTRFMDSNNEKSYAIGTTHPENIKANYTYQVQFRDIGIRRGTSRLWSVNYQRGYYYDHPNLAYRAIRGNGDEWFVFNEEYESAIKIKQYHKYNSAYYAPELLNNVTPANNIYVTFTDMNNTTFYNAYRYMESFKTVKSEDVKKAPNKKVSNKVLVYSGKNYEVFKFQVNEKATYSIYTSSNIGPTTTLLALADHNFKFISDISNISPVITHTLDKGDYYILIRPKIETSNINCILHIGLVN